MTMTIREAKEWFEIRDRIRQTVLELEVCDRCWRVRELASLISIGCGYCCRPGDKTGCLAR